MIAAQEQFDVEARLEGTQRALQEACRERDRYQQALKDIERAKLAGPQRLRELASEALTTRPGRKQRL